MRAHSGRKRKNINCLEFWEFAAIARGIIRPPSLATMTNNTATKAKRGRRAVADAVAPVTLSLDTNHLALAEGIAADMPHVFAGIRQTRGDVLRTAIARGLTSMREEIDARLTTAKRGKR
jgi:hypothetical protein